MVTGTKDFDGIYSRSEMIINGKVAYQFPADSSYEGTKRILAFDREKYIIKSTNDTLITSPVWSAQGDSDHYCPNLVSTWLESGRIFNFLKNIHCPYLRILTLNI